MLHPKLWGFYDVFGWLLGVLGKKHSLEVFFTQVAWSAWQKTSFRSFFYTGHHFCFEELLVLA